MALIHCPECNWQVSDKARACPKCGYPVNEAKSPSPPAAPAPATPVAQPSTVQTIEATSKRYKLGQVWGVLLIIGGMLWAIVATSGGEANTSGTAIGGAIAFIGLVVLIAARIGAWWNNG